MNSSPPPISLVKQLGRNPTLITAVGLFCSIFLVFGYYKIMKGNYFASHGATFSRGTRFRLQFLNIESPSDTSLELQSRGLDSFVMHSIPITQFKRKIEEELEKGNTTECAVCLGEFEEGECVKNLPYCSHVFHVDCIDTWFQTHSSCPLCRSYVYVAMHNEFKVSMRTQIETLRTESLTEEGLRQNEALDNDNERR